MHRDAFRKRCNVEARLAYCRKHRDQVVGAPRGPTAEGPSWRIPIRFPLEQDVLDPVALQEPRRDVLHAPQTLDMAGNPDRYSCSDLGSASPKRLAESSARVPLGVGGPVRRFDDDWRGHRAVDQDVGPSRAALEDTATLFLDDIYRRPRAKTAFPPESPPPVRC